LKIAILTDGVFPEKVGGMQKHSLKLYQSLLLKGIDVDLITVDYGVTKTPNAIYVKYPRIPSFPGHYIFEQYLLSLSMFKITQGFMKYDFVLAQGFTGWYGLQKGLSNKIGVHLHGLEMFQPSFSFLESLNKMLFRIFIRKILKSSKYIFLLEQKMSKFVPVLKGKSEVILRNGIDKTWITKKTKGKSKTIIFLFVGRNEYRKGKHVLESTFNNLKKKDIQLITVGPFEIDLPNVVNLGEIRNEKELQGIYANADYLVLPSLSEGLPTVILEAMAMGLPVIASDVGAVGSVVNGDNGWLIKPNNVEALEQSIIEAVSLEELDYQDKSKAAMRLIEKCFTWETIANDFIDSVQEIVNNERN